MAGVILASREERPGGGDAGGARVASGVGLALVAAVGFGCLFVGLDAATEDGDVLWAVLAARAAAVALVALALAASVALAAYPRFELRGSDVPALVAVGVFDLAAFALFSLASGEGLLSIVAVLSSLYPVVTILLARFVLKERVQRTQRAGILLAFTGIVLVVTG